MSSFEFIQQQQFPSGLAEQPTINQFSRMQNQTDLQAYLLQSAQQNRDVYGTLETLPIQGLYQGMMQPLSFNQLRPSRYGANNSVYGQVFMPSAVSTRQQSSMTSLNQGLVYPDISNIHPRESVVPLNLTMQPPPRMNDFMSQQGYFRDLGAGIPQGFMQLHATKEMQSVWRTPSIIQDKISKTASFVKKSCKATPKPTQFRQAQVPMSAIKLNVKKPGEQSCVPIVQSDDGNNGMVEILNSTTRKRDDKAEQKEAKQARKAAKMIAFVAGKGAKSSDTQASKRGRKPLPENEYIKNALQQIDEQQKELRRMVQDGFKDSDAYKRLYRKSAALKTRMNRKRAQIWESRLSSDFQARFESLIDMLVEELDCSCRDEIVEALVDAKKSRGSQTLQCLKGSSMSDAKFNRMLKEFIA